MARIILWGFGELGQVFYREMIDNPFIYTDSVRYFVDNNMQLWGTEMGNSSVICPDKLKVVEFDFLVIASIYEKQIREQIHQLGIDSIKIFSLNDYKHKCYADYRYREKYGSDNNHNKVFGERTVVYTAITGNYDELKDPIFTYPNIDYVCFTNNRSFKSQKWNVEYIRDSKLDDMYLAKKIKFFPHYFVKEYETSIWIDGKFEIKNDMSKYVQRYERNKPILCFPHFSRNCIYDEMAVCISLKKGIKGDLLRQIFKYYSEKYPMNNGLYEMGCIVRNHNDDFVKHLMNEWWREIVEYSYRDQISFPYVCWKNNFLPDICNLDINNNYWLTVYSHNE